MRRTKISIINASLGVFATFVEIIALLVLKQKFVAELGDSLYGLDQFVKNVVYAFSLAELGVGSVIGFSLYKPIAQENYDEVIAIMQFYKKIYLRVSFAVLTIGIIFMPLLGNFAKEYKFNPGFLYTSYCLFLLNSFLSYFFSCNKTLIISLQKNFILSIIRIICCILGTILLILSIIYTRDYIFYLSIWVVLQVLENLFSHFFAKRKYPYFFSKKIYKLSTEKVNKMSKNIKALITHRIGGVFVLNSDGIIVTIMGNLDIFGFFSNYILITSSVHKILTQIFDGIRASFGDFSAKKEKSEMEKIFLVLQTLAFIIYTWSSVFVLNLCQLFIELWMGKDKQLSFLSVVLFVLNFYLRGFRLPIDLVKDVNGIYQQDKYKPIIEAVVKLVCSIILGIYLGYVGVILGTTLSFVFVLLIIEPYVVYKYAFNKRVFSYYLIYFKYFFVFSLTCLSSFFACSFLNTNQNLITLMFEKFAISLFLPPLFFVLFLRKTYEFKFLTNIFKFLILNVFSTKMIKKN
ncbi:MAG: hypothetical protein LBI55_03220 [Oscillospiraceae bacterium]|jgi:O-antigen/teichoic acid export membrane protein|nr:hypothetical protein [Oscillospiraceae bacterium]